MILGQLSRPNPAVHVLPWTLPLNSTAENASFSYDSIFTDTDSDDSGMGSDSDEFRMYEFKVKKCTRGRSHDWTDCPYAHPGEKARRRDPRRFSYSGTGCPDYRKGNCKKGEGCEYAHGVFECWLPPSRYRTQPCKDGVGCRRRVCFFAHTPDQLRFVTQPSHAESQEGKTIGAVSPPGTPTSLGGNSVSDLVSSLRQLQLNKVKSFPPSWVGSSGLGSRTDGMYRPGCYSLPTTPTTTLTRPGNGFMDIWESGLEEEPAMERVESGRDLRTKMFQKLRIENSLNGVNLNPVYDGSN